jgi:hypothetical protein
MRSYEHAPESCWEVWQKSALKVAKFANLMAVFGVQTRAAGSRSASASVLKRGCSSLGAYRPVSTTGRDTT